MRQRIRFFVRYEQVEAGIGPEAARACGAITRWPSLDVIRLRQDRCPRRTGFLRYPYRSIAPSLDQAITLHPLQLTYHVRQSILVPQPYCRGILQNRLILLLVACMDVPFTLLLYQ